jgi:asparagine synthase (glutamine-hydrolysing)
MCGIAGIVGNNKNNELKDEITKMTDLIVHRGPDGGGFYYDNNFIFGHRRLAILDLSQKGSQPMEYMGKYVITYNGEIYNYIELREELLDKGYKFNSDTDTEVIMAAYDFWGCNCLNKFNGMWSFAIYNREKNIIFCSRDRFGVKPFYFTEINNKFAFASEIKQFTVVNGWKSIANKPRLVEFLTSGVFDHTNETLFENVFQLMGGERLIYDINSHTYKIERWYNINKSYIESNLNFNEAKEKFTQLLTDAVKIRLRSDVKVGSCLSGGLDSSSIVCIVNKLLKEEDNQCKQETVSSCFEQKKYDEQVYIDEVIKKTDVTGHKVFPKYENLFKDLDKITWHQDQPFASTSIYAQWNVFEGAINNDIVVMLDGQGADEQLAGYNSFHNIYFTELLMSLKLKRLIEGIDNYKGKNKKYKLKIIKEMFRLLSHAILPEIIVQELRMTKKRLKNIEKKDNTYISYIEKDIGNLSKIKKNRRVSVRLESIKEILYTSLPMLLHYEDRNSMAQSVESRVPFLDYRLVEFVIGLPSEYKINGSVTKYIQRESMRGTLPDMITERKDKMGFVTPEEIWIRENTERFREEISNACDNLNGLVDKKKTLDWFDKTISSEKSFDYIFWKIISAGRWIKVFGVEI